jgi:hypothetical protein
MYRNEHKIWDMIIKYSKVHSYLHKFNNWLHVVQIVHHFSFIHVEWHSPLVSEDWILPWRILLWWLWNNTPFLQTVEAKKLLRLKIYNLSNHHFMNYSCKQRSFTDTGDEVWGCRRKHTTLLTLKEKRDPMNSSMNEDHRWL